MIFKPYGTTLQSVDLNFDSKALNEIGFRRNRERSIPMEEFENGYSQTTVHELTAEAEGPVQDATEQDLLNQLEARIRELEEQLGDDQLLVFENDDGHDYPKTRQRTRNVVVEGENRLHFNYTVDPPVRVGVYDRKG